MKKLKVGIGILRPLILGMLLGGLGTTHFLSERVEQREFKQRVAEQKNWPPREFHSHCDWHYLKVDQSGWSTGSVGSFQNLDNRLGRLNTSGKEIVIPIFPTVFTPTMADKLYYDAILESDIEQGDKVLVIGTGSGSDAWVAWLKSQSIIYVIEVNPMAIVNARSTARLGDFQIKPILGDIRDIDLPEDFSNFDFVLWNMPFLEEGLTIEEANFHDGDNGSILRSFLTLLPSLLKKDGQAIILNTANALEFINFPNLTTKKSGNYVVYIIPNKK
ncbi:MAG: class I SAM-dependent methyltransferase [Planctomycetota bacterium]|jgi:hypothetical protein